MGLLTDPVVLSDGTANRTFSFKNQTTEKKKNMIGGQYIEDAAALAAKSFLNVKHDNSGPTPRHLFQRTVEKVPAASSTGERELITVNITVQASTLFTAAEILPEVTIAKNAILVTDFVANLLAGKL